MSIDIKLIYRYIAKKSEPLDLGQVKVCCGNTFSYQADLFKEYFYPKLSKDNINRIQTAKCDYLWFDIISLSVNLSIMGESIQVRVCRECLRFCQTQITSYEIIALCEKVNRGEWVLDGLEVRLILNLLVSYGLSHLDNYDLAFTLLLSLYGVDSSFLTLLC